MKPDGTRISDSQKGRARVALEQYGYSEDDFEWVRTQDSLISGESRPPGGETVYVIYKPTGFRRMYDGANWETEFEEDLKNQIFKPAS
ncbi:MAG TPA: hypothetical protein VF131_04755 [Blastocatellia bacterium]|nr:hypothetical protein [Blastocatellia bacterium]